MTYEYYLSLCENDISLYKEKTFKKRFFDEYLKMQKIQYPSDFKFGQKLYHYLHNDIDLKLGVCYCGKRCKFVNFKSGYLTYCSIKCMSNSSTIIDKRKRTSKERYGVDNPMQSSFIKNKMYETNMQRYGTGCSLHNEEISKRVNKVFEEKYGGHPLKSKSVREKQKATCLELYGVEHVSQSDIVKEKKKMTSMERYGVEYTFQSNAVKESIKKTNNEKYGVDNPSQAKCVKDKKRNTFLEKYGVENPFQSEEIKDKSKSTCIEKYGVEYASKSDIVKLKKKTTTLERYGNESYIRTEGYADKVRTRFKELIGTANKKHMKTTSGISRIEILFYDYLVEKFGENDVVYNYMSELYPYKCDFYIKPYDLYVELNAHWSHGGHPFDENSQIDIERLNYWKSKNSKYYNIAAKVWCESDVKKRQCAKENNLNYIEIFENDIKSVIDTFERKLMMF